MTCTIDDFVVDDPEFRQRLFSYLRSIRNKNSEARMNLLAEINSAIEEANLELSDDDIARLMKNYFIFTFKRFSLLTAQICYVLRRLMYLIVMRAYDKCELLCL